MSSKITTEKYDPVKLERLKHYLESNAERDSAKYYEIFVDNLKAVEKTNDPTCFDDYIMYMNEDSKIIKVLIYTSTESSPRNDKFIFTIVNTEEERRKEDKRKETLNGIEIQNKIDAAITAERDRLNNDKLKEELEDKTQEIKDLEVYIEELETALKAEKDKKYNLREVQIGNIASIAIEELLKRNPNWSKKVPLLGALSGLADTGAPDTLPQQLGGAPAQQEASASFSKKEPEPALSQVDRARLVFIRRMEEVFTVPQMEKAIEIIQLLALQPEQLDAVYEFLKSDGEDNNNETTENS